MSSVLVSEIMDNLVILDRLEKVLQKYQGKMEQLIEVLDVHYSLNAITKSNYEELRYFLTTLNDTLGV